MKLIESKANPTIKKALKLCKNPEEVIIIEGERLLLEALSSGCEPELIFTSTKKASLDLPNPEKFKNILYLIPQKIINEMSELQNNATLITFLKPKKQPTLAEKLKREKAVLVLDRLQDPGNIGNIIRTAEAMGIKTLILLINSCQKYNRKLIRAAMGSYFRMDIYHKIEFKEVKKQTKANKFELISANMEGTNLFKFSFPEKCAIVLGQEGQGVAKEIIDKSHKTISIPMKGELESLNVASSAAICLYEWAKQNWPN